MAVSGQRLAVSFCGGGFLGLYHVGVLRALREHAEPGFAAALVTGASAGALVGAAAVCGIPANDLAEAVLNIAAATRKKPLGALTPGFELVAEVKTEMERLLPDRAPELCSEKLFVATSKLSPLPRLVFESSFVSRAHLIEALIASSFVPGVTGSISTHPSVAGDKRIDGGLARNWPRLKNTEMLVVSAFVGDFHICPKSDDGFNARMVGFNGERLALVRENVFGAMAALVPGTDDQLKELENSAYQDSLRFINTDPDCLPENLRAAHRLLVR